MSKIEWTGETWNPIVGCSVVSPGCTNCYAMRDAWRKGSNPKTPQYHGLTRKVNGRSVWTGDVRLVGRKLTEPLRRRKPTTYFVNSMGDLFHEDVPDEWIDRVMAVMSLAPRHTFQVLTKRADRMRRYFDHPLTRNRVAVVSAKIFAGVEMPKSNPVIWKRGKPWPPPNVWLGVSAEDQKRWDERRQHLRGTPAAVTFVSAEPLLSGIDFGDDLAWIDWIIAGGESGPGARPCDVDWIRLTVAQCQAARVPVFVKQLGSCFCDERNGIAGAALKVDPDVAQIARRLRNRKGGDMAEWPADLQVREMPRQREMGP